MQAPTIIKRLGFLGLAALCACTTQPPTPAPAPSPRASAEATPSATAASSNSLREGHPMHDKSELEQASAKLVERLAAGDPAPFLKLFDADMAAALDGPKLLGLWKQLEGQFGPFQAVQDSQLAGERVLLKCQFKDGDLDAKLVYRDGKLSGLFFAPSAPAHDWQSADYVTADSIEETASHVGAAPWRLDASIVKPRAKAAAGCPAVVLVHGSGPNDRDGTIGPNKPLRDLAEGLASQGVCVLRYEKRTRQHGEALVKTYGDNLTLDHETIDDALAAVATLQAQPGVDAKRIFVLGHSLGGSAIPRIAKRDRGAGNKIRGFVMLAGASLPLEDAVVRQLGYIAGLDGKESESEQKMLTDLKAQAERVKQLKPGSTVAKDQLPLSIPTAYWLDLKAHPHAQVLRGESRPTFVLQGGRDYQVTDADFAAWKKLYKANPQARFELYPSLNHLFIHGEGPSTPVEYQTPGHVAKKVIDDIAAWVKQH